MDAALSLVLKGSERALVVGKQNTGDDFIGGAFSPTGLSHSKAPSIAYLDIRPCE